MQSPGRGTARATTAVITKEVYHNDKGEPVIETQWHPIVALGRYATIMHDLLRKGKKVAVRTHYALTCPCGR